MLLFFVGFMVVGANATPPSNGNFFNVAPPPAAGPGKVHHAGFLDVAFERSVTSALSDAPASLPSPAREALVEEALASFDMLGNCSTRKPRCECVPTPSRSEAVETARRATQQRLHAALTLYEDVEPGLPAFDDALGRVLDSEDTVHASRRMTVQPIDLAKLRVTHDGTVPVQLEPLLDDFALHLAENAESMILYPDFDERDGGPGVQNYSVPRLRDQEPTIARFSFRPSSSPPSLSTPSISFVGALGRLFRD